MTDEHRHQDIIIRTPGASVAVSGGALVRRGLDALQSDSHRVMHFPGLDSFGQLFASSANNRYAGDFATSTDLIFRNLGEAKGDISVPPGMAIRLIVAENADLSTLDPATTHFIEHLVFPPSYLPNATPQERARTLVHCLRPFAQRLSGLGLNSINLTSEVLDGITSLEKLREIDFDHTKISVAVIAQIASMRHVHSIDLRNCDLDYDALHYLRDARNFREINLRDWRSKFGRWTPMSGPGLDLVPLSRHPDLLCLDLHGRLAPSNGIIELGKLEHLEILNLSHAPIGDYAWPLLRKMRRLRSLDLSYTAVSDSMIREIEVFPELMILCLDETDITDYGLARVLASRLPIRYLSVSGTSIGDASALLFGRVPSLQILQLNSTYVTDSGLAALGTLPLLDSLSLRHNRSISDRTLAYLRDNTKIKSLDLAWTGISDRGLDFLDEHHSLEYLDLSGTKVTDKALEKIQRFESLETLMLFETDVTDDAVAWLKKQLPGTEIFSGDL